jgi:hypothetical protein
MTNLVAERSLVELEAVVLRGRDAFIEVGAALVEIKERKLWRQVGDYSGFEDYCVRRLGIAERTARRQMTQARANRELPPAQKVSQRQAERAKTAARAAPLAAESHAPRELPRSVVTGCRGCCPMHCPGQRQVAAPARREVQTFFKPKR